MMMNMKMIGFMREVIRYVEICMDKDWFESFLFLQRRCPTFLMYWIRIYQLMDDLADMERCEAKFMKMWNRFIKSHIQIPDCAMPKQCREFISTHAQGLVSGDLRQHLLQHLLNLWDNQVLSADHMHDLMALFDTFEKKLKAVNDCSNKHCDNTQSRSIQQKS